MLGEFLQWISFNTWLSLACFVAGVAAICPLLPSRSLRGRLKGIGYDDVEGIGLVVLLMALVGVGVYNHFGPGAGA